MSADVLKKLWQNFLLSSHYLSTYLYKNLKISKLRYLYLFLTHRYSAKQFSPQYVQNNLHVLYRCQSNQWLDAESSGKLRLLGTPWQKKLFIIKNALLWGALQSRVEKVIFFTFLTLTLELDNPLDRKNLHLFLNKKIAFLERLLKRIEKINARSIERSQFILHIDVFRRTSLLQDQVILKMHQAIQKQKETHMMMEAKQALKKGLYPILVITGVSGSYWMRGTDRRILGLFKPFDEEVHAPNNPVGPRHRAALGQRVTRMGCRSGESVHHEVAAYIVDEFFGFGIVPRTAYASFTHHVFFITREDRLALSKSTKTKYGSFQEFVSGFVPLFNLTPQEIDTVPLDEFQLLVVLDVIIGNLDRNIGNILYGDQKIAAIDHGLCFPDRITDVFSYWYWSYFKQGEKPLLRSICDLLNDFPFERLKNRLNKRCYLSPKAFDRMHERVVLFTEAINAGCVPSQLPDLFQYDYLLPLCDRKSTLKQKAIEQVRLYQAFYW